MTRKLTFLILALFALIAGPGWGQKASGTYTLVTDASTLSSGDVIVLGCAAKGKAAGAMGTGAFLTSVDATISNGTLTSANAIEITLGGSAGAWTLTTSEGQITTSAAKALKLNNGTQKTWTISITSAGVATITGGSYGSIQYNASSPRFLNYTSAQTAIEIYKKETTPSPKYTVSYHTNGDFSSEQVYAGEIQLTAPTNIPNGYTYVGWTDKPITGVAQSATYFSSYNVREDVDLYAVFAIAEVSDAIALNKMGAGDVLNNGDNIVIVATKDNWAKALYQETVSTSYVNFYDFTGNVNDVIADSKNYVTLTATGGKWKLGDATNGYVYNASSNNLTVDTENSTEWTISWNNTERKYSIKNNDRWLSCRNDLTGDNQYKFRGGGTTQTNGTVYFDLYKLTTSTTTYSNFCTTVNALSGTIADQTYEGAYYIAATSASEPAQINGTVTINGALGNADPTLLIIEDGAQLIHHNAGVKATVLKSIKGYSVEASKDGYYLIANPTNVATVAHLNDNNYDLYTFNPAGDGAGNEWINMKPSQAVANGTGYLYANSSDVTLEFAGELTPASETEVTLVKATAGTGTGIDFPGFNLIGNPFACNAYPTDENGNFMPFYKTNGAGSELTLVEIVEAIAPCEGFFVEANADGDKVTISTTAPTAPDKMMSLNVSNESNVGTIDRAIVNFDGRNDLHKFMLNPNHTNISLAMNGEEFAAISTEAEGELPVNFKAEKNGTYTITVNTENIDAEYLHLIDNMTGMDIDVLATPSYTFEAKTSDYASRFKLVFNVNNAASASSDSNFAYMSDGNLVISDIEGEATLQIIDMMGRVVSTETVSGNFSKALNLRAGAYVLNLNGMTQKIVVE